MTHQLQTIEYMSSYVAMCVSTGKRELSYWLQKTCQSRTNLLAVSRKINEDTQLITLMQLKIMRIT